jgi:collagenase-like PrtC family protease
VPLAPHARADITELARFSAIYKLTLRGTSITNDDLKLLTGMSELQSLNVSSTKVDGRRLGTFQAFQNSIGWI